MKERKDGKKEIAMSRNFRCRGRSGLVLLLSLVFAGCAAEKSVVTQFLYQNWSGQKIALFPVGYSRDYQVLGMERAPYDVDIRDDLWKNVERSLKAKGYQVVAARQAERPLSEEVDAAMEVLVYFFIYDAYERDRSGIISVHARAELKSPSGELLWKDEASARAEELGKPLGFVYPHAETLQVLSRLADRLVDSLPDAGERN